ncbi:hypothetical protein ASG73_01625 [Janibacter sp. Soil728]|uniref:hypothetical protein n=1 Tax=Janibacter sp. Soil728 TaxID=1736393 RepID=UPI0006F2F769|nr:hypothetical protein [Janibacter sp. Soil728]KRE39080.1 hypothetical protein ASG73_01625 [Janibacter sp. Soil728]
MTDNQDPTGMRHLLASLKESGPMPADLNDRIRASLADEQAARAGDAGDAAAGDADGESGFWGAMDEPGPTPLRRRRPVAPWILGAAAATVIALGVGGLMLKNGGGQEASSDAAAQSGSSAQPTADRGAPADATPSADSEVPAFVITASGADYSKATLADGAAKLLDNPTEFPDNTDDKALGTMTTAAGATDCLARLGQPQMQAVVIDVARFDGKDGLLLIAESLPDGPSRAWAVTSGCEPIWPNPVKVRTS